MRMPHFLLTAMEGTSVERSRWRVTIYLKPHFKSGFPPRAQIIMRNQRKDKRKNKNYNAIPVEELITHYRVTKAYKSHAVGVLLRCKGIIDMFFRITSFLSKQMSTTERYGKREKTEHLST